MTETERIARLEEQGKNQSEVIRSVLKKIDRLPDQISGKVEIRLKELQKVLYKREDYCAEQNARITLLEQFRIRVETSWKWIAGISTIAAGLFAWLLENILKSLI